MMIERRGRIRRRGALLGVALTALLVWGCEGNHAFAPVDLGPDITDLFFPSPVESGDEVSVGVRALGLVRVDSIIATLRVGSYEETQVAPQVDGILADFSAQFDFSIPPAATDTLGTVEAFAVDAQNNVGPLTAGTFRAIDTAPPTVSVALPGDRIGLGTEIPVTITAEDNIGLQQIGFQVRGPDGEIIAEVLVEEDGRSVVRTLVFEVPMGLPLGDVVVVGVAVDHEGNVTFGSLVPIELIDVDVPEVEVITPESGASVPAQDSVFTQVMISDNDAVDSVTIDGVAHRGDPELGTDTVVVRFLPRTVRFDEPVADTLLQRFLLPAADSTAEDAYIRATAYDREGNTTRDSVLVSLLIDDVAPSVQILEPAEGDLQGVGDSILVTARFQELPAAVRSGVTTLTLEGLAFRGNPELGTFEAVERFTTRTLTFDPPRAEPMQVSRYLPATADMTSEFVHIIATATDAWGNQNADTVRIKVVNDTIAPRIEIHEPGSGDSVVAGDPLNVGLTVFEGPDFNESGVRFVTIVGIAHRTVAGSPTQVTRYQTSTTQFSPPEEGVAFSVLLNPTGDMTAEDVWIRVLATDALGNTRADSVMITVTAPPPAPPAPEIGMLEPWLGHGSGGPTHPADPRALAAPEVAWLGARRDGPTRDRSRRRRGSGGPPGA